MVPPKKVWIDTDAGVDDAMAILMLLSAPYTDIEVVGISTVHGNANSHQVALNVLRLLKVTKRLDIPVYEGCATSILGTRGDSTYYHGLDGLGDVPDPEAPTEELIKPGKGVDALINAAESHKGNLTLVALGPLTNLAMAIRLEPNFGKHLASCYIMGGSYEGKGNASLVAEFNFHTDPEAAFIVLESLGTPITLACWELCINYTLPWKWYADVLSATQTKKGQLIKAIETKSLSTYYAHVNVEGVDYTTADQFTSAFILNPKVIKKSVEVYGTIELSGDKTRGQMLCDWMKVEKKCPNVTIVTSIDKELYMQMLHDALVL